MASNGRHIFACFLCSVVYWLDIHVLSETKVIYINPSTVLCALEIGPRKVPYMERMSSSSSSRDITAGVEPWAVTDVGDVSEDGIANEQTLAVN